MDDRDSEVVFLSLLDEILLDEAFNVRIVIRLICVCKLLIQAHWMAKVTIAEQTMKMSGNQSTETKI